MATRTRSVFVNTAGLLYASLGFLLSVLTALFGIFNRFVNPSRAQSFHARPHLPRKLRGPRRKVAVPRLSECISVEKECTYNVKSLRRRSKSLIPIITIDHFGSTNLNFPNFASKTALPTKSSLPKPVNTDSLTMTRPRIVRRSSFPVALPHSAPPPLPSARGSSPVPSRKEPKSNFPKVICKTASAADFNQETLTLKSDALFLCKAGNKKLPTLRTQPYGAPNFCMPPSADCSFGTVSPGHNSQR